ncbi:molybdenum cofactor guanylyltransferase [Chloroflexota bacterium]
MPAVSAIVLSGGKSKRLGEDKALLMLDGEPLLARTIRSMGALSDDLIVVTNHPQSHRAAAWPARLVPDETPGLGSLVGVYSGLKACRHPKAIVVACDMPFLSVPLLRYMVPLSRGYDVVIPRRGRFLEPLHAIYGRTCLPAIERVLASGRRRIVAFFDAAKVRFVEEEEVSTFDPHHLSFLNVNTLEDWELIKGHAARRGEDSSASELACR